MTPEKYQEIMELKYKLKDSDYKVMKYMEGTISDSEFIEIKKQRQSWRDRINELEKEDE